MLEDAGVPDLPYGYRGHFARPEESDLIGDRPWQFLEEVLGREKCILYINALGTPPADIIEACHNNGMKVGALAGKVHHAIKHRDAGCDLVVSVGGEAAGHTGDISTFVLLPQIADAVAPLPVLAAGGVSTGRHVAAAMVLGAQGVWTGSIWLPTQQSELSEAQRNKIIAASSEDTVISRCLTGKTVRMLKSKFTEAWEAEDAPEFLPMPLQSMLVHDASSRIDKYEAVELLTYPAGQAIGQVKHSTSVRQVMQDLMTDYTDALDKISALNQG